MATTYKYKLETPDDKGYIEFNSVPDLTTTLLLPGDKVVITGRLRWNSSRVDELYVSSLSSRPKYDFGMLKTGITAAKGAVKNFSLELDVDTGVFESESQRIYTVNFAFIFEGADAGLTTQRIQVNILRYRLNPAITSASFERTDASGTAANDGLYVTCRGLKLSLNPQAVVGDITKKTVTVTAEGSSSPLKTVTLTTAQLDSMLSSSGYQETTPTLFPAPTDKDSGVEFHQGKDHYIDITIGDDYDQITYRYTVNRAFCLVDFARKKNGGFAVGMYSNSTDDKPLFEVDKTHESHLYGPVYNGSGNRFDEYVPGDTIDLTGYKICGYITSGNTGIQFSLPLPKLISSAVQSVSADNVTIVCRQGGAYVAGSNDSPLSPKSVSVSTDIFSGLGIIIELKSAASGTNNDVIAVQFRSGRLTFSDKAAASADSPADPPEVI